MSLPFALARWLRGNCTRCAAWAQRSHGYFARSGEEALTSFNYVGGDGWMTDEQQQQFTAWLDADVRSTAKAIAWVEEQFGLDYSDSGMRKLLKQLDYRYKQPAVLPTRQKGGADAPWQGLFS
jgi:transposase